MKKIFKILSFVFISVLLLILFTIVGRYLFIKILDFDILRKSSYTGLMQVWNSGGKINFSLLFCFLIWPSLWLYCSIRLYKYGFWKFIFWPVIKLYIHYTKPKNVEEVHVNIKNLGGKDKNLDEIISQKMKEKGMKSGDTTTIKNLRQQISTKIEENGGE